ncbi:MAG TPA: GNAT family N-acetyltransferase [Candidatus Thermoplasmatota archaeon]|nr:GNAT family N-acetyltransferase [Candidatus Thermoplasmatota archaeon]
MKQDFIIEPINRRNFEEFLSLIDRLAEYEKLTPPDEQAKRRLRKDGLSKTPKYEAYVGKKDGKYVGYIIFYMTYSSVLGKPTLYIEDLFVVPEYRRIGIGQHFFDFALKQAKERDCGRVEWHVLDWNKPGLGFYEKNQATHLSHWLFYRLTRDQFDDIA